MKLHCTTVTDQDKLNATNISVTGSRVSRVIKSYSIHFHFQDESAGDQQFPI
jgi:hypothetical protein